MTDVTRGWCMIISAITLIIGFVIGILIGVYAVPDESKLYKATREPHEIMDKLTTDTFVEEEGFTHYLMDQIKAEGIEEHLEHLCNKPHVAGTTGSQDVARYIFKTWREQGLDSVQMPTYDVLLSYPSDTENEENVIELIRSKENLDENIEKVFGPREAGKPQPSKDFPDAFHAYSPADDDVVGDLVYVNYGTEEDFDLLEKWNVTIEGNIVIARYGHIFRGNKVYNAAKRGAKGVILYTDPEEVAPNGTSSSHVFNNTWWLPGDGKQRGSVYEDIGDPLTPGLPAISDVSRIDIEEADLPSIPSQPIGYSDAEMLLKKMGGMAVDDEEWKGKLAIQYRIGPGFEGQYKDYVVRMKIYNQLKRSKIFNVIATIPGDVEPDRYVIVGNAHDAWGYGYVNPSSGTAQLLEITDAFTKLLKKGWKPRRTIIFCTWDASKYGQIGSTEWVEEHLPELSARTVVYINCESCIETEDIRVSASPILREAVIAVSKLVDAPDDEDGSEEESIFEEWRDRDDDGDNEFSTEEGEDDYDLDGKKDDDDDDIVISTLGAESDHAAFAFYAGIPSIDVHADDEGVTNFFPAQNTAYDVRDYLELLDPDLERSESCARYVAVLIRYFSDRVILPFDIDRLGALLKHNLNKIRNIKSTPYSIREQSIPDMLTSRNITLFDDLEEAVDRFNNATKEFNDLLKELDHDDPIATRMVNDQMMLLERAFIQPSGQRDDWFHRHLLFGPSDLDKYSDSIFPDLSDLIKEIDEIEEEEDEERMNDDSDEGEETDIDPEKHWEEMEQYMSSLLVAVKQATSFLKPFPVAYDD